MLSSTARLIQMIRNELKYFNSPVDELFKKTVISQSGTCAKIVKYIIDGMNRLPYPESVEKAKIEFNGKTPLNSEEYLMLFIFLKEIGTLYGEDMIKLCDYYSERFRYLAAEARDELTKKGRLYISLFSLLGLAAAVILI